MPDTMSLHAWLLTVHFSAWPAPWAWPWPSLRHLQQERSRCAWRGVSGCATLSCWNRRSSSTRTSANRSVCRWTCTDGPVSGMAGDQVNAAV